MTTDEVIRVCRRTLEEVDTSTSDLTDEEILTAISDERDVLELMLVPDFDSLTVGYDQTDSATYGILPADSVTLELGTILAYRAAASLLRRRYREMTRRGEIGVSWSSGLESESTLAAGRDYQMLIADVENLARRLVAIKRWPESGRRMQ